MAKRAWHGLIQVLIGPDPPSVRRWRSPQQRRRAYAALGVATLALCVVNLVPGVSEPGQLLLALPVVAPLPLAARYPMLAWRIGWLALLLAPLVPATWWGGWPWGRGQVLALLGAFCLAGIRQQRPELWWMWALTLIPWWLWHAGMPDMNGPASATIVFTAVAVAVDSTGPSCAPSAPWPPRPSAPRLSGRGGPCWKSAPGSRGNCTMSSRITCR